MAVSEYLGCGKRLQLIVNVFISNAVPAKQKKINSLNINILYFLFFQQLSDFEQPGDYFRTTGNFLNQCSTLLCDQCNSMMQM